nr:MAG TPA: hypothetical protein [Caudoviricetes sp.]
MKRQQQQPLLNELPQMLSICGIVLVDSPWIAN